MIRLGLEPKTYCLEGSCSIQLSYRTGLFAGAKVGIFCEMAKFSDGKSYICTVIEGKLSFCEAFCGLERFDIERVGSLLLCQSPL